MINETESKAEFEKFIKHPQLLQNLTDKMGFTQPTPIQLAVGPSVLEGRNLVAGAKTGSGKTIAFLAPLSERLLKNQTSKALVLAPTRELVLQIDEEATKLLDGQTDVVSVPVYGGIPIDPQILAIRHHKPRLVIATPGRIIDLAQEEIIKFSDFDAVVLDEADRMLDMGFAPQVTQILEALTNLKQTLLFSATLPDELNDLMVRFCPDPFRIQVDAPNQSSETIQHKAIFCDRRHKLERLIELLSDPKIVALVFARTRNRTDELHRRLSQKLSGTGILHAGFGMSDRERTLRAFRDGQIRILVATDVVSRGIDVDTITHVVHYDLSDSLEDYIHRSGRSGRAGREGMTVAFFESDSRDSMEKYKELQKRVQFEILGEGPRETRGERDRSHSRPQKREGHTSHRPKHPGARRHETKSQEGSKSHERNKSHERTKSQNHRTKGPHRDSTSAHKPKPTSLVQKTKNFFGKFFGSR